MRYLFYVELTLNSLKNIKHGYNIFISMHFKVYLAGSMFMIMIFYNLSNSIITVDFKMI